VTVPIRAPLGLPAGSIRGILVLFIVVQFWLLLLLPDTYSIRIPMNLYFLLTFVALFFVAHGRSIASATDSHPSPLHLPAGTLRVVIFGGSAAVIGYLVSNHYDRLLDRLRPAPSQLDGWPMLMASYVGGFVLGYLFRVMPFRNSWAFQSFLAWISLIAMTLLFIEIVVQAFVLPTLKDQYDVRTWEAIVTGVTACYFGTRS